jgi:hypothetical protein
MKTTLLISAFVAHGQMTALCDEAKNPATEAFSDVKANLGNNKFDDTIKMFLDIKKGFADMKEFLLLCDKGIKSEDELTRSAAALCAEAIGSLLGSGHLEANLPEEQFSITNSYEWKNMDEISKNIRDLEYQKKNIPSYRAYIERATAAKKDADKAEMATPSKPSD